MLILAVAGLAIGIQTSDYFPLKAGMSWEYDVTIEGTVISAKQKMTLLEPVKVGAADAIPMQVFVDGKLDSTIYYRVQNGFVTLVATDPKEPLPQPVPVLPLVAKSGAKWDFDGSSKVLGSMAGTKMKSRIVGTEQVDVLGDKRTALRVEVEAEIGRGTTSLSTKTVELYVSGIGLVYRKQDFKSKQTGSVVMRLIRFEGGSH